MRSNLVLRIVRKKFYNFLKEPLTEDEVRSPLAESIG